MTFPEHPERAEYFVLPVMEKYILYSPRTGVLALINRSAVRSVQHAPEGAEKIPDALAEILRRLDQPAALAPAAREGPVVRPAFLGLVTTRGCNLDCRYCDFPTPAGSPAAMTTAVARRALDGYFRLLGEQGAATAEIHFFGGEPMFAPETLAFSVEYALSRAAELGIGTRFEATTNGVFTPELCRWAGERIDAIVLSLDGPQDIQDRQRPAAGGRTAFPIVYRNAKILSDSPADLILRACISQETAARMEEIACWMAGEFTPEMVCFEPLSESDASRKHGLRPPDPWAFAAGFIRAEAVLERRGIRAVAASAELEAGRVSSCPMGNDALIVSPDGTVDACYLLANDWRRRGLDLRLGSVEPDRIALDPVRVQAVRDFAARAKPLCAGCFCRFHCAGGCHVRHDTSRPAGAYDNFCIQTRILSIDRLLRRLDTPGLADRLIADHAALERAVLQTQDLLLTEDALS